MSLRRFFLHALGALALLPTTSAQQTIGAWTYDGGATKLTLTAVFDPPPPTGYQPLRVEMTNGTADRRAWSLKCRSSSAGSGTDSAFEVAVDPGKATTTMVLVPLTNDYEVRSYRFGGSHEFTISAASAQVGIKSGNTTDQRASGMPAVAISDRLAQKSLTQLNDEVRKTVGGGYGNDVFGSRFDPAMLPEEWLGYGGFDYVLMTDDEWLKISPGARAAVLQWTRFAGELHLYRTSDSVTLASLGIHTAGGPALTADKHGLGAVSLRPWNGDTLDAGTTVAEYRKGEDLRKHLSSSYANGSAWTLQRNLGERSFAGWQVVVFLLLFGILVGPVNLFVLAPTGRRHKLFFTTPLIAAGASLLLIGLILIQDGTGGKGRRFVAIEIAPEDAMAYVTQEQISRTGVLIGSSFELLPSTLCHQVVIEASPWSKLHAGRNSQDMSVRIDGTYLSGNWFQSRTVQGQFLRAALPNRQQIDLVPPSSPDEPPAIVSSLAMELGQFAYVDGAGQVWRAPAPMTQGTRTVLVKSQGNARSEILAKLAVASTDLQAQIIPFTQRTSIFLATAAAAPDLTLGTLQSIRWEDDQILIFGRLVAQP